MSNVLKRLTKIRDTQDLLIEFLKEESTTDIYVFNTWLGKQRDKAQPPKPHKEQNK